MLSLEKCSLARRFPKFFDFVDVLRSGNGGRKLKSRGRVGRGERGIVVASLHALAR